MGFVHPLPQMWMCVLFSWPIHISIWFINHCVQTTAKLLRDGVVVLRKEADNLRGLTPSTNMPTARDTDKSKSCSRESGSCVKRLFVCTTPRSRSTTRLTLGTSQRLATCPCTGHRARQRGLRPAAARRRELHGRVHDGRGRNLLTALTATGTVAGAQA